MLSNIYTFSVSTLDHNYEYIIAYCIFESIAIRKNVW